MKTKLTLAAALAITVFGQISAKSQKENLSLYPQHFPLHEVELTAGPLLDAQNINIKLLMQYDVDRLLTPFVRQAGLKEGRYADWEKKHPNFENWGSGNFRLDGHVGGHYVSALALAYAASHDEAQRAMLKERMDYCVDVLDDCQMAFDKNDDGMRGFIGGQPVNEIWPALYKGDLEPFKRCGWWVTFYCEHKVLAGLRDAYVYGGSEKAKTCFLKLCDWAVALISNINDNQVQELLRFEHGGINESIADAYALTGDKRYLEAAKRFCHQQQVEGMQDATTDYKVQTTNDKAQSTNYNETFLDGQHANTQVPKFIGFERINQLEHDAKLQTAATNFWDDVARHRTVCIGGNSVSEHFMTKDKANRYIDNLDGPESCNSNNMLKLSELLFNRTHDSRYVDFYEQTMYNHILSTQDPNTGGYVYFTSLRPQSYRIYSRVNEGMWCCVGTGMENHSKYGHFIYTHEGKEKLYVNLFIPSVLESKNFGIRQETTFPSKPETKLTVTKAGKYTIAIRRPEWAKNGFKVTLSAKDGNMNMTDKGYLEITRKWKAGDVIEVKLPMSLRLEECPNLPRYVAIKYGPVLLAAQIGEVGEENLPNEYAHEERMGHAPGSFATQKTLSSAPMLIGDRDEIIPSIRKIKDSKSQNLKISKPRGLDLTFTMPVTWNGKPSTVKLLPFSAIHHARYSCYFWQGTAEEYANSDIAKRDIEEQKLLARTIDFVAAGEQQSEAGHEASYSVTASYGQYNSETYRDAQPGGYIEYALETKGETENITLMIRHTLSDRGRKYLLTIDGEKLADIEMTETVGNPDNRGFTNIELPLPSAMLQGKKSIKVRFNANQGTMIPGIYFVRLLK